MDKKQAPKTSDKDLKRITRDRNIAQSARDVLAAMFDENKLKVRDVVVVLGCVTAQFLEEIESNTNLTFDLLADKLNDCIHIYHNYEDSDNGSGRG